MNNPFNTIKNYIKQEGNPRQLLLNFAQNNNQNPMIGNLINLAKNGNIGEIEKFARNAFKEQGRDFDSEFNQFKNFMNR